MTNKDQILKEFDDLELTCCECINYSNDHDTKLKTHILKTISDVIIDLVGEEEEPKDSGSLEDSFLKLKISWKNEKRQEIINKAQERGLLNNK